MPTTKIIEHKTVLILFFLILTLSGYTQTIQVKAGNDLNLTCLDEAQLHARVINWHGRQYWHYGIKSICFADKNTLFAVGGEWDQGLILKSSDGGHNWTEQTKPPAYNFVNKIFFINHDTGFIVGGRMENLIMKTTNGGISWIPYYFGYYSALNSVYFANDSVGFAVGSNLFMKTTNCGATWEKVTMPPFYYADIFFTDKFNGFAVGNGLQLTDESAKMVRTNDGGVTWNEVNLDFNYKLTSINAVNNTVYVTTLHGMVLISHDYFKTWEIVNTGSICNLNSIAFRDSKHGITVGSKGAILTTDNGGYKWKQEFSDYISKNDGPTDYTNGEGTFSDVVFIDDSIGLAAGIPQSNLDSSTFVEQTPLPKHLFYQWTPSDFLSSTSIPDPLVSPNQSIEYIVSVTDSADCFATDTLRINVRIPFVWAGQDSTLLTTQPYELAGIAEVGRWQTVNMENYGQFNQVKFFSKDTGYAITNGNLVKTVDGGKTFQNLCKHHHLPLSCFHFLNEKTGFVAGTTGMVLKTFDGGDSWIKIPVPTEKAFESIFFVDSLVGFCSGWDGTIVKTTDGGLTWSIYTLPDAEDLLKIYFVDKQHGFVVGHIWDHKYAFTTDGGNSWQKSEYAPYCNFYTDIFFVDDSVGYILGSIKGPLIIQKTTDGGKTWEERKFIWINDVLTTYSTIFFTDRYNGYVGDQYGEIIRTWDGGKTFYVIEKMQTYINDLCFLNPNEGFMASSALRNFHAPPDINYKWIPEKKLSDPESIHTYVVPDEPTLYNFIVSRENSCAVYDDVYIGLQGYGIDLERENSCPYTVNPNPVTDILYITSGKSPGIKYSVKIYAANGMIMLEDAEKYENMKVYPINPTFNPGLYYVVIADKEGMYTKKIIIK